MNLRSRLIRLAHTQPALRPHLLPLLRDREVTAGSLVMVRAPGGGPSYKVDRDLAQAALLNARVPADRVRVLFDPFKDEALVTPHEVNLLEKARLLKKPVAPRPLSYAQAETKYDRLMAAVAAEARENALADGNEVNDLGTALDLAEGAYFGHQAEFAPLGEALGYSRKFIIRSLAELIGG